MLTARHASVAIGRVGADPEHKALHSYFHQIGAIPQTLARRS
jgi:hypothetical protein